MAHQPNPTQPNRSTNGNSRPDVRASDRGRRRSTAGGRGRRREWEWCGEQKKRSLVDSPVNATSVKIRGMARTATCARTEVNPHDFWYNPRQTQTQLAWKFPGIFQHRTLWFVCHTMVRGRASEPFRMPALLLSNEPSRVQRSGNREAGGREGDRCQQR